MSDEEWKGGFDRASWMGRYAEQMMRFGGMQPYEAECWALNAWEASADDADPDETAEADMAYSAEDALMTDLAVLAGGLTLRGRRALLRIGDDWTQEGAPGPKREDAYSLWWGRSGKLGLIESPRWEPPGRWFYRLTPLGMQLQRFLSQEASQ